MRRILAALGIGTAITGGFAGAVNAQDGTYKESESPRYEVVRQVGDAELRTYAPHILAEVAVQGDRNGALNRGFRTLAGYIFGGNDGGVSVSMTSPVTQSANIAMTSPVTQTGDGDVWTVTFMMPSQFTLDTLPKPNSDAVRFVEVPSRQMIMLVFSGRANSRALEARTAQLEQIIASEGIPTQGAPVYLFYDDPFTLPQRRRNEVGFEVTP